MQLSRDANVQLRRRSTHPAHNHGCCRQCDSSALQLQYQYLTARSNWVVLWAPCALSSRELLLGETRSTFTTTSRGIGPPSAARIETSCSHGYNESRNSLKTTPCSSKSPSSIQ